MSVDVRVDEMEIQEVLDWAHNNIDENVTDFEDGTYEEGVFDAIRWVLGLIQSRPDQ